jgi:glycosyltransferase involved in cell wall biosynthesis
MKLLLIKIGKAWHILAREGLVSGGRRILSATLALFRRVRPGDILFISGGVGDSARYRCEHVAEALRLRGYRASVTVQDNPFLLSYAQQFSVFVFHRVLYTGQAVAFFAKLKALKKEIIFETDDLVYDPQFLVHMDYFQQINALERKLYEHGVGGEILADRDVKVATTTTSFLAEKLRARGKQVFILPNQLSVRDVALADAARQLLPLRNDSSVRVGYLSGTLSHNKDFATITEALLALLKRYPRMRLVLTGPIDTDLALEAYEGQIERVLFIPREKFFSHIATLDINLAPLELDNPFCESKSELKFFEAGIVGVPTVAVANQTFREAIEDGVDGYVARGTEEWIQKIGHLISDREARLRMGEKARETALARYTTKSSWNEAYGEYIKGILARHVT